MPVIRDRCHHRRVRARYGLAYRGHSVASKEYGSKQQFIDRVLAPFGVRFTVSEPFLPFSILSVYAVVYTLIFIFDFLFISIVFHPYENSYASIM